MVQAAQRRAMLIGGEAVERGSSGETDSILNPATGEVIAEVPRAGREDVDRAVQAARRAFAGTWGESTPAERSLLLLNLAQAIEDHSEELGHIESENVGKPKSVWEADLAFTVDNLRYFAGACRVLEGKATGEYMKGYTSMLRREPIGVVGSIAPWNYPLMMAIWKVGPALAAGNCVVLKPSEWTPLSALRLGELAADILPAGVLNVVTGPGEPTGVAISSHPGVDMVSLTGDVATGKEVARAAADNLKRVHLELGGKAPVLIFDDADREAAAAAIKLAGFFNSGQDCTAATRILTSRSIYDNFVADLVSQVESIKVGRPDEGDDVEMGPVVSESQLRRVEGFVDRARQGGAEVLTGGRTLGDRGGFFYAPTVVTAVSQTDEIIQREVFGPAVTVQQFASDDEALAWANDVPYGLSASVWTTNVSRALRAARALKFGTVWVNDHIPLVSEMPHGGFRQSGYGKDMSPYSLDDYSELKHVMVKWE